MSRLALIALLVAGVRATVVRTPFGERPSECVVQVSDGATVEAHPSGEAALLVTHRNGTAYRHDTPPACVAAAMEHGRRLAQRQVQRAAGNQSCDQPPCTCATLPCNNWIDNAGSMNVKRFIGGMSSTYLVPGTPAKTSSGQTLFYFIGAENTDGTPRHGDPAPSGRAILQPVLTFDPSGWCNASATGWCFSSWYCCPKDLTTHSPYIQDVTPGSLFLGKFNLTADGTLYETVATNTETGATTSLKCPRQGRNFNWADVTQEVYAVAGCDDFAAGPMEFRNVTLWDTDGAEMSPEWLLTSDKPCKGTISRRGNTFTVLHSNEAQAP